MARCVLALLALSVLATACDPAGPLSPASGIRKGIVVPVPYVANVTLTDLGGVDGGPSAAADVNDSGTVVGYATIPGYVTGTTHVPSSDQPFVWTPSGGMSFPINLCCGDAFASGINDSGVVAVTLYPTSGNSEGWVYRRGRPVVELGPLYPTLGAANSVITAKVGKNGRINGAGWGTDRTRDQNAVVWDVGRPSVAIAQLNLGDTTVYVTPYPVGTGVADNGDATGYVDLTISSPWIFDMADNVINVPLRTGGDIDIATSSDLNTSHTVVGSWQTVATLWTTTQQMKLGTLPGGSHSNATGINEDGYVVGTSDYIVSGTTHSNAAFIWISLMGMVKLPSLAATHPACAAKAMNHDMQGAIIYVAGQCVDTNGYTHAVRWKVTIGYRFE
jgi:uncharacterized membrane protein